MTARSGLGQDLLGANGIDAVDGAFTSQHAIGADGVAGGAADVPSRIADRRPVDVEGVADESARAGLHSPGNDPLDGVPGLSSGDDDGSGVLDPARVGAIHDVGPHDAITVVEAVARKSAHRDAASAERDEDDDWNSKPADDVVHVDDGSDDWHLPRWAKVLIAALVVVFLAAMSFAVVQPVQVLPRIRLAPGYSLIDQRGMPVTSEDARGTITLYTFVPEGCADECDTIHQTIDEVVARVASDVDLAGTEFRAVTLVLGASPARTAADATRSGATTTWLGVTGADLANVVGLGFAQPTTRDAFRPGFTIVDGWGMIRGEYRYSTLADDADKLVRHIDLLGAELRNDHGFASFVYEAAHAFQCYP